MKQTTFTFYYFTLGILFIILQDFRFFYPPLLIKALIVPSLMLYYYSRSKISLTVFHRFILLGLMLSWFGDVLIHFSVSEKDFYFSSGTWLLMGLSSFLLANAVYGISFSLRKGKNSILNKRLYQLILVTAYGILIIWLLYNKLIKDNTNYRVPVIAYTIVVLGMLAAALNRFGKVNGVSYMLVVLGSLFFVISVSLIAFNQFYGKFEFARILITLSYLIAQYLIAIGCLRRDFDLSERKPAILDR